MVAYYPFVCSLVSCIHVTYIKRINNFKKKSTYKDLYNLCGCFIIKRSKISLLPLQYKHQWLISAVNTTGDGSHCGIMNKMSDFTMATNGINDKIDVT